MIKNENNIIGEAIATPNIDITAVTKNKLKRDMLLLKSPDIPSIDPSNVIREKTITKYAEIKIDTAYLKDRKNIWIFRKASITKPAIIDRIRMKTIP